MNPIVRNILAVLGGIIVGSIVNMGVLILGMNVIPLPEGATMDNLAEYVHLFELKHFISPFLAHALGTLVGAIVAGKLAATNNAKFSMGIGVWFLIGGIANSFMIPAPEWFTAADLILAYLPMGWLAARMVNY